MVFKPSVLFTFEQFSFEIKNTAEVKRLHMNRMNKVQKM